MCRVKDWAEVKRLHEREGLSNVSYSYPGYRSGRMFSQHFSHHSARTTDEALDQLLSYQLRTRRDPSAYSGRDLPRRSNSAMTGCAARKASTAEGMPV